jgi:hypothetical protein
MHKLRFLLVFLSSMHLVLAQVTVALRNQGFPLTLNHWYAQPNGDSVFLSEFKFYLVLPSDSTFLVDASEPASLHLPYFSIDDETVLLRIGMDSSMNTCGRLDGAYDPLLGMYWAWNTGYTQLKCKGIYQIAGKHIPFEYHLGGYKYPYATSLQKWIRLEQNTLGIQLDSLLTHLPVLDQPRMMLPGPMARTLFVRFTEGFQ